MAANNSSASLQNYVRTFADDPLHSAAYLNGLKTYLAMRTPTHTGFNNIHRTKPYPFAYLYDLSRPTPDEPIICNNANQLNESISHNVERPELIFLTGYPSRQWLRRTLDHYRVDARFLQSHLDFLPGAKRDWYTGSGLPSRNRHCIRLLIPSIVFFESDVRDISVQELHDARASCRVKLKEKAKNLQSNMVSPS